LSAVVAAVGVPGPRGDDRDRHPLAMLAYQRDSRR
jgi:hypothetical protein